MTNVCKRNHSNHRITWTCVHQAAIRYVFALLVQGAVGCVCVGGVEGGCGKYQNRLLWLLQRLIGFHALLYTHTHTQAEPVGVSVIHVEGARVSVCGPSHLLGSALEQRFYGNATKHWHWRFTQQHLCQCGWRVKWSQGTAYVLRRVEWAA